MTTERLDGIAKQFESDLAAAATPEALEAVRVKYAGRSGLLKAALEEVGKAPPARRAELGKRANALKQQVQARLEEAKTRLGTPAPAAPAGEDLTLPGIAPAVGTRHPITQVMDGIVDIFARMGFSVAGSLPEEGPEVESEEFNFEALNIPLDHAARDPFDTFYVGEKRVLRSHTTPVQARHMLANDPPARIVMPGRVFRPDTIDARHYNVFHQVDGLAVAPGIAFADLKGVMEAFVKACFGKERRMRLRPSFFPFTEPSAEVDMSCICGGSGCSFCGGKGWIEILGCGLVHENVFRWVDARREKLGKPRAYDPERISGFAWGMGVERIASLKFGIPDVRLFYQNDLRFLRQF